MPYSDWKEYQEATAKVFQRLGCDVKIEHRMAGARAKHDIDVAVSRIKCNT